MLILPLFIPAQLYAEPRRAAIEPGIFSSQILALWGVPDERQEREVFREEIWRYGNRLLLIRADRFVEELTAPLQRNSGIFQSKPEAKEVLANDLADPEDTKTLPTQSAREILTEIMRNYPDDGVIEASKSSPMLPVPQVAQPAAGTQIEVAPFSQVDPEFEMDESEVLE